MRLLLLHVKGPTSFNYLRTVNGKSYSSFREAAEQRGLLEKDTSIEDCLTEATLYQMPVALRQLFSTILVYCEPTNPRQLWNKFYVPLSEDFMNIEGIDEKTAENKTIQCISDLLESVGKDISTYDLPIRGTHTDNCIHMVKEIDDELKTPIPAEDLMAQAQLNSDQEKAFKEIVNKVICNQSGSFFIDGPGGTGKTFLYRAILAAI